jgi:hypothetical protein
MILLLLIQLQESHFFEWDSPTFWHFVIADLIGFAGVLIAFRALRVAKIADASAIKVRFQLNKWQEFLI